MISYELRGRLGNILQEVYTVFWYCRKWNIPFDNIIFPRSLAVVPLGSKMKIFNSSDNDYISTIFPILHNIKTHFCDNIFQSTKDLLVRKQFNPDTFLGSDIMFSPYQRIRLVDKSDDHGLFRQLFLPDDLRKRILEKYKDYSGNSLAISIRREDFSIYNNGKFLMKTEYWDKIIHQNTEFNRIIIFSDDINWCRANLGKDPRIMFHDNVSHVEDLISMSLCKKIIGNPGSSFPECAINLQV